MSRKNNKWLTLVVLPLLIIPAAVYLITRSGEAGPEIPGITIASKAGAGAICVAIWIGFIGSTIADAEMSPGVTKGLASFALLGVVVVMSMFWSSRSNPAAKENLLALSQQRHSYQLKAGASRYEMDLSPIQAACAQKEGIITPAQLEIASRSATGIAQSQQAQVLASSPAGARPLQAAWRVIGKESTMVKCAASWAGQGEGRLLLGQSQVQGAEAAQILAGH